MTIEHFHAAIVIVNSTFGSLNSERLDTFAEFVLICNYFIFMAKVSYENQPQTIIPHAVYVQCIGIIATCTRSNYVRRNDNVNEKGKEQEKKERKNIFRFHLCAFLFFVIHCHRPPPSLLLRTFDHHSDHCPSNHLDNYAATKHKINTKKTAFIFSFWPFFHPLTSTKLSNSKREINVLSYRANKRQRRVQMPRTHAQKHKSSNHLNNKEIE